MNVEKMTSMEYRAMLGLNAVFSLRMLGIFMVVPALTTYGMTLQGANESLIGLAIGSYGLAQAIFQIPFGFLSDKFGRKSLIVFGLLIFAFGSIIAAITHSIWSIIFSRILQGSGAISAPIMALLSDCIQEQNRIKAMALMGMSVGFIFTISMVLGPIATQFIGLHGLFLAITILALISIAITLLIVPTPSSTSNYIPDRKWSIVRGNFHKVLTHPQLLKINFGIFCLHSTMMSCFIALPTMMTYVGLLPDDHWKIYFFTMLISLGAAVPLIRYIKVKKRMRQVLIHCTAVLFLSEIIFLLFSIRSDLWVLLIGIQLFFFSINIMEAIFPSFISKESPDGYTGTAMGVYSTFQFIGMAFGGILGGWLLQMQGSYMVFLSEAILTIVWWIVSITLHEPLYLRNIP